MRFHPGYRARLLLAISAIGIVMLTLMTVSRIYLMEDVLDERTLSRMETIGNILRNDIQQNMLDGDGESMRNTVIVTAAQSHIQFVSVIDRSNLVIFSSEQGLVGKFNPYKDSSDIRKERTIFVKSFQMKSRDGSLGTIQIGFSLATLDEVIGRMKFRTLMMNLASLLVILFASWLISGKLLAPIVRMKAFSERIARGDFSERLRITSNDVIGELELALNNMASQLNDLTENLNKRVEEATRQLMDKTLELEESNRRLKELDKVKTEFVSIVSHELRTPLTGIIGFAKTLRRIPVSDEQKEKYLAIIESEGKRLSTLIEDFLDISKIESGNVELQLRECDVCGLLRETTDGFALPVETRIRIDAPAQGLIVRADMDKIKQVVMNILNNAVRYTAAGQQVVVTARDAGASIEVSIRDNGPGIAPEDLSRIFDKFYRGKDEVSRKSRGSGLGLAIAKGIVDMHGGKIWVASEPGKGSDFRFALPKEVSDEYKGADYRG